MFKILALLVLSSLLGCATTTITLQVDKEDLSYCIERLEYLGKKIVKVDTLVQDYQHIKVINIKDTTIIDTVLVNYYHVEFH